MTHCQVSSVRSSTWGPRHHHSTTSSTISATTSMYRHYCHVIISSTMASMKVMSFATRKIKGIDPGGKYHMYKCGVMHFGTQVPPGLQFVGTFKCGTMMSGRTSRARTAIEKCFTLQSNAIAGFSSSGDQPAILRFLECCTILYKITKLY